MAWQLSVDMATSEPLWLKDDEVLKLVNREKIRTVAKALAGAAGNDHEVIRRGIDPNLHCRLSALYLKCATTVFQNPFDPWPIQSERGILKVNGP